jgi:hypothetical protein
MSVYGKATLGSCIDLVIGYCAPELYQMASAHGGNSAMREAVVTLLEEAGLSWPQFLAENAERLGLDRDDS